MNATSAQAVLCDNCQRPRGEHFAIISDEGLLGGLICPTAVWKAPPLPDRAQTAQRMASIRKALAIVALAAVAAAPMPARADDAAKLLPWQIADALTTRAILSHPCGYERDPLVRPFVRSDLGALAGAVVTNLLVRRFVHQRRGLRIAIGTEQAAVANNLATLERERTGPGLVCR
jgi:hypothetical protein